MASRVGHPGKYCPRLLRLRGTLPVGAGQLWFSLWSSSAFMVEIRYLAFTYILPGRTHGLLTVYQPLALTDLQLPEAGVMLRTANTCELLP